MGHEGVVAEFAEWVALEVCCHFCGGHDSGWFVLGFVFVLGLLSTIFIMCCSSFSVKSGSQ